MKRFACFLLGQEGLSLPGLISRNAAVGRVCQGARSDALARLPLTESNDCGSPGLSRATGLPVVPFVLISCDVDTTTLLTPTGAVGGDIAQRLVVKDRMEDQVPPALLFPALAFQ